jgi:hypothetical protein
LTGAVRPQHPAPMELIVYGLAAVGALALLLLAGVVFASFLQPEEPRHVDPNLLVEIPPAGSAPVRVDRVLGANHRVADPHDQELAAIRQAVRRRIGEILNWTALAIAGVFVLAAVVSFTAGYGETAENQAALLAVASILVALAGRAMLYVLSAPVAARSRVDMTR